MLSLQVPAPKLMVWPKCPALVGTQLLPWVRRTVPEVAESQRWECGGAGMWGRRDVGIEGCQGAGMLGCRDGGMQKCWGAGIQGCRVMGMQGCRKRCGGAGGAPCSCARSFSALQQLLFFSDFQKYFEVTRSFFPGSPSPLIVLMAIHCGSP